MATSHPEKLKKLKHRARAAFERSNPGFIKNVQGDLNKIREIREIADRAGKIRKELARHLQKHQREWAAKEAVKVYNEREKSTLEHPRPGWASPHHNIAPITEEARRRVLARNQIRLKRIGEIQKRMQERVAQQVKQKQQNRQSQSTKSHHKTGHLKSDVHLIVARTQNVREKAKTHFNKHRNQWIENAKNRGSQTPEKDVHQKQTQRLTRINQAEHRMIHNTFQKHGRGIPKEQAPAIKRDFGQAMG